MLEAGMFANLFGASGSARAFLVRGSALLLVVLWVFVGPGVIEAQQKQEEIKPARFGDFAAYWTAARCFVERRNNYDPAVVAEMEAREDLAQTFVIWNPPWVYPLLAPFGLLPFAAGAIAWCLINVTLLMLVCWLFGRQIGMPEFRAAILGITFVPAGICLGMSQLAILVLAGAVLYGWFLRREQPVAAGVSLALCSIKPHLIGLIWILTLLAGPLRNQLKVFAGLVGTLALLTLVTHAWHPNLLGNFVASVRRPPELPPTFYYSATIGMWLRMELGLARHVWIQFLPAAGAAIWFVGYLRRYREGEAPAEPQGPNTERAGSVNRQESSPLASAAQQELRTPGIVTPRLLAVTLIGSVLIMPYGWHYDQVVLLPAYLWLLRGAWMTADWRRWSVLALLALFEVGQAAMLATKAQERLYVLWPLVIALAFCIQAGRRMGTQGQAACRV